MTPWFSVERVVVEGVDDLLGRKLSVLPAREVEVVPFDHARPVVRLEAVKVPLPEEVQPRRHAGAWSLLPDVRPKPPLAREHPLPHHSL